MSSITLRTFASFERVHLKLSVPSVHFLSVSVHVVNLSWTEYQHGHGMCRKAMRLHADALQFNTCLNFQSAAFLLIADFCRCRDKAFRLFIHRVRNDSVIQCCTQSVHKFPKATTTTRFHRSFISMRWT